MGRWSPDAGGRLAQAAFELFMERGYEQTTVADIAKRAGLTERTFFRYFTDKREVFFHGAESLKAEMLRALAEVPADCSTIEAVQIAAEAIASVLRGRKKFSTERSRVVAAHADLQERELIKRAGLTSALAQALRERGVTEPSASYAADMGLAVFHIGFATWIAESEERELVDVVREGFAQLKAVASGG